MTSHVTLSLVAFVELLFISTEEKRREREKKEEEDRVYRKEEGEKTS
jgi:hypothetical protein